MENNTASLASASMITDVEMAQFAAALLPGCTHRHEILRRRPLIIRVGLTHAQHSPDDVLALLSATACRQAWLTAWGIRRNGEVDPGSIAPSADGRHVLLDLVFFGH
jgi:hypothetical protein